ncbi:Ribonuclease III family protein [Clostridiaceae bacterium JG1575]|nr:Ribonuclease III family protein [Clostridiaceae bacterium JG1575]
MISPLSAHAAAQINPLNLAFLGDTVWEGYVRDRLFLSLQNAPAQVLHHSCVAYVRASSQSDALEAWTNELSEEEEGILRRGRNQKPGHCPRNVLKADYRRATGFEALLGYVYLLGDALRLQHLMTLAFERIQETLGEGEAIQSPPARPAQDPSCAERNSP